MRRGRELDDQVSTALAEVQARQQSLSRGAVLPHAASPSAAAHGASSLPVVAEKQQQQQHVTPFQWLKRRIVRRSERAGSVLEDLGSLEFVPSASLATVRTLIDQFIALPPRREFAFVHPTTNTRVELVDEKDVSAAMFPFICIVLLPGKEVAGNKDDGHFRPVTAKLQLQLTQQTDNLRPRTVDINAKRRAEVAKTTIAIPSAPKVDGVEVEKPATPSNVKESVQPVGKSSRKQDRLPSEREKKTTDSDERKLQGVPPSRVVGSKRISGELKLKLEDTAARNPERTVILTLEQATTPQTMEKQPALPRHSLSATIRPSMDSDSSEPALVLPGNERDAEQAATDSKNVTQDAALENKQDVEDEIVLNPPVEINVDATETTPEVSGKPIRQTKRPLRRSRRFRSASIAKLAEIDWDFTDLEQDEVATDEQVEKMIHVIVQVFYSHLPGIEPRQVDAACRHYGIDYQALELQGVLLALDNELSTRCNHVRGGVDGQLTQYLLKQLPTDVENLQDTEALRHFENSLNLFAGMRGWQAPTKLRASCFEDKQRLQLIPPSDSRRLSSLRLSDKDRQLFTMASTGSSAGGLDKWLGDGLEITYVLLYGFLRSRRNSGPKALAKLDAISLRQDRIQAAIQKLSSFSFEVWKRLEFRTTDVEDFSMVRRLNELLKGFLRDGKLHSGEIEGSVFFPAIIGYLARKSEQLTQSLSGLILSAHGAHGPQHSCAVECVKLLRQQLELQAIHSTTANAHLLNNGLKIVDIEKINASRSSTGLGRIYMNERESVLTHHQCKMMASDKSLHLKARWELGELSWGKASRYFFVEAKEIALEYVFVRMKPDHTLSHDMCWEEREKFARKEAQYAFTLLCGKSLHTDAPLDVAIGVGINIVHSDLLPHINSVLSLNTALREYPETTSVSVGYCYAPATQVTRVVFRVHAETYKGRRRGNDSGIAARWKLPSVIEEVGTFLNFADEDEAIAFCDAGGLRFLYSRLQEERGQWRAIMFGLPFFERIYEDGNRMCRTEDILQATEQTISVIPRAIDSITKENLQIVFNLVETKPEWSDVVDETIHALQSICFNAHQPVPTGKGTQFSALPMTETQRKFSTQGGLKMLVTAAENVQLSPERKKAIEIAIVNLLHAHDFSLRSGLLVHWRQWLEFYVERRAWMTAAASPALSVLVLSRIYKHFFTSDAFVEPAIETCTCGCQAESLDVIDGCVGIMEIFVRLMLTEVGVTWAQEEMKGPEACISFLSWSVHSRQTVSKMTELQDLVLKSLTDFIERMTSSHQYLRMLSSLTPRLLSLLNQQECPSLHHEALRVLSIMFRLAVDKKVWSISMERFLAAFYQVIESLCDDSLSNMNDIMVSVIVRSNYPEHVSISSDMLALLHEEHVNFVGGSGQLSPVARSRTKSLLQTLVSFCSLTWNSVLQPFCQIPAVLSLGWMLARFEIAEDLAQLELDELLLTLMENDNTIVSILAIRTFTVFLFQSLSSRRTIDEHRLKRLCNLLTTALGSGTRLMLSPKRTSNIENPETIQFAANEHNLYLLLLRYGVFNNERQSRIDQQEFEQEDLHEVEQSPMQVIWEGSGLNDSSRAEAEKLAANLKLLTVLTSLTRNVVLIGNSDEIRQIIVLLVQFIRDRAHPTSHNIILYLLSLRNIVWATRWDLAKWGYVELTEASFLRKLLQLSMDRVHQDLASGILWGLAKAYENTNTFLLSFEVDDALAKGAYLSKKTGFAVMVDNLASHIASGRCAENDSGALASMIANFTAGDLFITNYGYSFVLKLIDSTMRSTMTGHILGSQSTKENRMGEVFGTILFYENPIKDRKDRELLQLCRIATKSLKIMQRSNPESILDEAARTRATILPLLNHSNKDIAVHAIWCCSSHLQAHPTKCGKLFESDVQDKVISFFFDEECPAIQAAAFSCMKLALADQSGLPMLQTKLFSHREKIVSCLRSPNFQVKRKALVLLVEAIFRLDDQIFLDGVADAFAAPGNQGVLLELFNSLSKELEVGPAAGGVLQLLTRLILKLDLVAHTDGDQLVHGICLTLKAHSTDTFVRPTLLNCLRDIVTQEDDRVNYLSRKSRLDAITGLLPQQLTLSELRNIASMLLSVASKHSGIRHYLSGFVSGCIPKVASVLGGFSEYLLDYDSSKNLVHLPNANVPPFKGTEAGNEAPAIPPESPTSFLLKVTTPKVVYISHFTEDVYEQILRLLLLLLSGPEVNVEERYGCLCEEKGCHNCDPSDIIAKARCGHLILRLVGAHRISCATYDITYLLSTVGTASTGIVALSIEVLETLAANYQCRVQMLRGASKLEWSWLPYLVTAAMLSEFHSPNAGESDALSAYQAAVVHPILLLGHLCAAKELAQRLVLDHKFISRLCSYISPGDALFASSVDIRRVSSFTLAWLTEHSSVVQDTFVQEKMAKLALHPGELDDVHREHDKIVLANKMVLGRNRALLTPGLQGRNADERMLATLVSLLPLPKACEEACTSDFDVGLIGADVLSHLLYFRVNVRDERRLRSVLWRYARSMSPTKPVNDESRPSSKRLTAYLHSWIGPTLQKLRKSIFAASEGDSLQLLHDDLVYTYQQLRTPSASELLFVLISLHLRHEIPGVNSNTMPMGDKAVDGVNLDVIMPFECAGVQHTRQQYLQQSFSDSDRSTREPNDFSFYGSAHMWLFLRKLWDLCVESTLPLRDTVQVLEENTPRIFTRWKHERGTKFSASAFDRRQCFLEFLIAVGETESGLLSAIDVRDVVDVVVGYGLEPGATLGREYKLLSLVCQQFPEKVDTLAEWFNLDLDNGHKHTAANPFCLFWGRVRLHQLPVKLSWPSDTSTKIMMLDPSPDADLATIFGIDLLRRHSSRAPQVVQLYAQCQGDTELLDMVLLASRVSALQMTHALIRRFLSNLLYLVNQLVEQDQAKYNCIFSYDPRYLRCIVDLIYAPAHQVQTTAIKLLHNLAQQSQLFAKLSRIENLIQPLGTDNADAAVYIGEILSRRQMSPPFTHDRFMVLLHIWYVPFFADLSTTELVKLSMGFSGCTQPTESIWTLLINDNRSSAIPEWMLESNHNGYMSFTNAIKHIQKRFEAAVHKENHKLAMYSITKEAYLKATTVATRRRIATRLSNLLKTYNDDTNMYRGSLRTRNGLVTRLGRLLIEDRAEIIRRVAFTKRVSERVLFEQMQTRQLSDLLSILQETPLFEGIERDRLANLAFLVGDPVEIGIDTVAGKQKLPLLVLFDEGVEFEMFVQGSRSKLQGTASRGGLLGFPMWLENKPASEENYTVVHKCGILGVVISREILESGLTEAALALVDERLHSAYSLGDPQKIARLMGLQEEFSAHMPARRRLQSSASSLLVQLTSADDFIDNLLNDSWAIRTIVDVALAALPADVVRNALTATAAMTVNEAYAKQFWTKASATRKEQLSGMAKSHTLTPVLVVAELVNRFKLRLWLSHPEILKLFFLIQSQVARYIPTFWPTLEEIWTEKYLCSCLDLLRSGQPEVINVVGSHLSSAIPHRMDYLTNCGQTIHLHLELAQILVQTRGERIVGLLQLFTALCSDEILREDIWGKVVNVPDTFGGVFQIIAGGFPDAFDAGNTGDIEVYCCFIYLVTTSGVNELLDLEYRNAIEARFGILSTLLTNLHKFPEGRMNPLILRCIGSICIDAPPNSTLAAITVIEREDQTFLVDAVVKRLVEVDESLRTNEFADALLVEATFSCVTVIASVPNQMKRLSASGFVALALQVIIFFTTASQPLSVTQVSALRAVVRSIFFTSTSKRELYVDVYTEANSATLLAGYERISTHLSTAVNNLQLLRLLKEYTELLSSHLSSKKACDTLWTMCCSNSDLCNRFVTWVYHWITFDASTTPKIAALMPNRSQKRLYLLEAVTRMQDTAVALATKLGAHEEFSVILSFHPDFGKVVTYIFAAFHESSSFGSQRVIAWIKFVCFVAEQWDQLEENHDGAAYKNRFEVVQNIRVLQKACYSILAQSDTFVCYAVRLTWLLIKVYSIDTELSTSEFHDVIPLANTVLKTPSASNRSRCNVIGLMAELSVRKAFVPSTLPIVSDLVDVVRSAMMMLTNDSLRMTREIIASVSSELSDNFLSSRKWNFTDDQENNSDFDNELRFGIIHQTLRLVLHLCKVPQICVLLSDAPFFHPLVRRTLFVNAINSLRISAKTDVFAKIQEDGLQLITILNNCTACDDFAAAKEFRAYCLTARREGYLCQCIQLLSEPQTPTFRIAIMESLLSYVNCNICASTEVATLREQGNGDLMGVLLSMFSADNKTESWALSNTGQLCLQLYNSLIEFSFTNAAYAARPINMKVFGKLREVAARHDALLGSDIPRTFFYIARMLGNSNLDSDAHMSEAIWEMVSTVTLHPQIISHPKTLEEVLEMLRIVTGSGAELLQLIVRDWEGRGRLAVMRLIDLANCNGVSDNDVTEANSTSTTKLAMKALAEVCVSETICEYVSADADIVFKVVTEYPWSNNQTQLLKFLVQRGPAKQKKSLLLQQIETKFEKFSLLRRTHQLSLLMLLPSLPLFSSSSEHNLNALQCVREEITSCEDKLELLIFARALRSVLQHYDLTLLSNGLVLEFQAVLTRLITNLKPNNSTALMLLDDENFLGQGRNRVVPSALELLLLVSLCQFSSFSGTELLPLDQHILPCFTMWMDLSSSRLYNSDDHQCIHVLTLVISYYLDSNSQTESSKKIISSRQYWRTLTRRFASLSDGSTYIHHSISKLMLQLLRGPSSQDFLTFASDTLKLDLIDILWWKVRPTSPTPTEAEKGERCALWCSILSELCLNRDDALSIMEKGFLEHLITLGRPKPSAFLQLFSSVFRLTTTGDHELFFQRQEPRTVETLTEFCVNTIEIVPGHNVARRNATEVLYALAMNDETLPVVWKAFYLEEVHNFDLVKARERICAVSEMLLLCHGDIGDLVHRITLILKIFGSSKRIAALIQARKDSDCWPMVDILVDVLERLTTSMNRSERSIFRPIQLSTRAPAEFLPYYQPSGFHAEATILALQLVYLCAANERFAASLKTETDLLHQLFICLATSQWEISSTAATTLSTIIRCDDENDEEGVAGDISRYNCENGAYRKLEFFSAVSSRTVFSVSPSSSFPGWFVLLVRWARFYSVNLSLLGDSQLVLPFDLAEDDFSSVRNPESHELHENLVVSVLELLLYCVSNFHADIYKTSNDNPGKKELEHSLLLQSLLALCQRRSNSSDRLVTSTEGDTCIVSNGVIRSRALELVQLLCSLDLPHTSSVEVFVNERQMLILMMMVERSASSIEQCAAIQLMEALALHNSIKALFVGNASLLSRLGAWLENEVLNVAAAAIFQRLACSPDRVASSNVFGFSPNVQKQLAYYLFVGAAKTSTHVPATSNTPLLDEIQWMRFVVQPKNDTKHSPRWSSFAWPTFVQLNFQLLEQSGKRMRTFQNTGRLQKEDEFIEYEMLLEQDVKTIRCSMVVYTISERSESKHLLEFPLQGPNTILNHNDTLMIRCESEPTTNRIRSHRGILPRLLRQGSGGLNAKLFYELSEIVVQFCKNFDLFCDQTINLPSQILTVLGASVDFSPDKRMDISCLEALATWFPKNPTISFFKKSISHSMQLIQGLRRLSCVKEYTNRKVQRNEDHGDMLGNNQGDNVSSPTRFMFLEKLVGMIADVDVPDCSPNTLNTIFLDCTNELLYLCAQCNPELDPNATFLSLVAIAIRRNVVHCQAFLTNNAQRLLRSVFDAGIERCAGKPEQFQGRLLAFASLVTVRLARCPISDHGLLNSTHRLELFTRVSFEVFARHSVVEWLPSEAAENLILACGFFNDGLAKFIAVDADTREAAWFSALSTDRSTHEDRLTIVETLLLFLGRPSTDTIDRQTTFDSFDRLAASIVASLVEKLPARGVFEQTLLQLLSARSSRSFSSNLGKPNVESRTGRSYEEQCLQGLKRCLGLTRYDFKSELNALRLTYYSSIRAGVRTGIIPPQCSGAFQHFDQEHLLSTKKISWHLDEVKGAERRQSFILRHSGDHSSISSNNYLLAEDSTLDSELRELLLFTNEHSDLLSVLTVNRKKAMTSAIRIATQNARILMAFHAMASLALDCYVDTERLQNQHKKTKHVRTNAGNSVLKLGNAERTTFMEWLLLLEELAGLLCSGLHELDSAYYAEIARQFRSLIVDLPLFLRKIERTGTHSRPQALLLFLDNLHRLLKRATNRNELRVVSANGTGVVDQTKSVRERLRRLDAQISTSLGLLLETPGGMANLSRALVAMTYMWRRMMGVTPLDKSMATSKESVGVFKKITEKLSGVFQAFRRPKKAIRAVFRIVLQFGSKQRKAKSQRCDSPSAHQSVRFDSSTGNTDEPQSGNERDSTAPINLSNGKLLSPLPFNSLELALDHLGWESLSAKRVKHLLQLPGRRNAVSEVLSVAFSISAESVDKLSVLELAEHFHNLDTAKNTPGVLCQLEAFAVEDEVPFTNLPSVVHDKMDMSLWRLMVRPIQRVRLFHLYQQLQRFVLGDPARRQRLLEGYWNVSPQKPTALRDLSDANGGSDGTEMVKQKPKSENVAPHAKYRKIAGPEEAFVSVKVAGALGPSVKVLVPQSALNVCDSILSRDPLSDAAAMRLLRKKNEDSARQQSAWWSRGWLTTSKRQTQYRNERQGISALDWALRLMLSLAARLVLVLAFWRQEELRADLKDPTMARAFDDLRGRDEFYRLYHAKKGLGEFFRVWMPSSGRLGLLLWQERRYALVGTLLSVIIARWLPTLVFPDASDETTASERNTFMTRIVYSYGIAIFMLSVASIARIARNRFVLLEQTRLRLRPISRYYQNALAVAAIAVELVQLNSLAFDPAVDWDDTDELPSYIQWLGRQGITRFGVSSASELQALGILLLLLSWFFLLKCANKFQDTSVLLHRVLTKDLPALVNGFFYMGTISAFFSFLACIDCSHEHNSTVKKCISAPQSSPFLIAHPSITCWTPAHQWYALLGLWGISFFLPIGLLAHGMSQVLFQRETLDIKYAPVLLLVTQLVKAVAATAQAFFPFEPLVLTSLGLMGNGVLLVLTWAMHSCSLWYIKYVKCSIYAASCWASLGAIHRLRNAEQSSSRSLNMIYFGWLSIGLTTAVAVLVRVWRRSRAKQRESELRFAAQQRLLNAGDSTGVLGAVEQKFMKAAKKRSQDAFTRAAFVSNAAKLSTSEPPPALTDFMVRARGMQSGNGPDAEQSALFMQNARVLAKQLREHQGLRRRR